MSTVTGIVGVGVGILVPVVAFGPLDPLGVCKASTVTGSVRVGVGILVTVVAFSTLEALERESKKENNQDSKKESKAFPSRLPLGPKF